MSFGRTDPDKIQDRLKLKGATDDEIEFLMEGQRVELNAMTSDQFIAFVERKLTEAGITKIVPSKAVVDKAYRLFARGKRIKEAVKKAIATLNDADITIPDDLEESVRAYLSEHPAEPWEDSVAERLLRTKKPPKANQRRSNSKKKTAEA